MGLLESISELTKQASSLAKLREEEARHWKQATLATNTRVTATATARANLASAMEYGLPIEQALIICEKFSLLDLSDVDFFKKQHGLKRLDVARFPGYLRKAAIHTTPVEKLMLNAPDYGRD